jgi:hypothetical protein
MCESCEHVSGLTAPAMFDVTCITGTPRAHDGGVLQGLRARVAIFAAAFVIVAAVVIVLIARNDSSSKRSCVTETVSAGPDTSLPAEAALSAYVAQQEEGPLPLNGNWTKTSDSAEGTVFSTDVGGHWDVTVRNGQVRSFSGCPS